MTPRRRLEILLTLTLAASGCVLRVGSGEQKHEDEDTGEQTEPSNPFECPAWEAAPEEEIQGLVGAALGELEAEGQVIDESLWGDPQRFGSVVAKVYNKAGCPLPEGVAEQALHSDYGPDNYCGPGHGSGAAFRPTVSSCMNLACRDHDACYSMCSGEITTACSWTAATAPCDKPFLERIDACPPEPGTWFASEVVSFIAHTLYNVDLIGCDSPSCPALEALGAGICSTDRHGSECLACLTQTDLNDLCYKRACWDEPDNDLCYAANCPLVGQCFGGYGVGEGSSSGGTGEEPEPGSGGPDSLWDVTVEQGMIPQKKASGYDWDGDVDAGFYAPDPFVVVSLVEGPSKKTPSPEDTFFPEWKAKVFSAVPAYQLEQGITFEVWDEDLVNDDKIGDCWALPVESDFGAVFEASCTTTGLKLWLSLSPTAK